MGTEVERSFFLIMSDLERMINNKVLSKDAAYSALKKEAEKFNLTDKEYEMMVKIVTKYFDL